MELAQEDNLNMKGHIDAILNESDKSIFYNTAKFIQLRVGITA